MISALMHRLLMHRLLTHRLLHKTEIIPTSPHVPANRWHNTPVPPAVGNWILHVASEGGYAMRHYDLTPLYRSTVGFDRLFSLIDQVAGHEAQPSYPPYNIERIDENSYRISIAVAGFGEADLSIESKENVLTVKGEKQVEQGASKPAFLYQGIAGRAFERRFQLADHVHVTQASLENGLLHIDLLREIPEAKKPKTIPIGASKPATQIEAVAA
jgi:molecular chaperone IbpA